MKQTPRHHRRLYPPCTFILKGSFRAFERFDHRIIGWHHAGKIEEKRWDMVFAGIVGPIGQIPFK